MAGLQSEELECPVCREDFTNPKLLPCKHTVCRDCVLTWLHKGGGQGGCPLCRAPILSSTQQGQGQLAAMVDLLPTDFATADLVLRHRVLIGPHVCGLCVSSVSATSYCFACRIKICKACTGRHQIQPATKDHGLEQLTLLTEKRLAANHQAACYSHANRPAELYCSAHQELICMLCATSNHRGCPEVKAIAEVAGEKRTELTQQSQRLKEKGAELANQIKTTKAKFREMRQMVNDVFDDLLQCMEKRRQHVNDVIHMEEEATLTSLAEKEKAREAITSHSDNIDHLLTSVPDDALLQILRQLKSRLDDLESESGRTAKVKDVGDIVLDSKLLTRLKSDLSKLGEMRNAQHPHSSVSPRHTGFPSTLISGRTGTGKPKRAELAAILRVGDRVRRRRDWTAVLFGKRDEGGPGTVTAIPSRRVPWSGWVDVRWDSGGVYNYRMGYEGCYDLDLA